MHVQIILRLLETPPVDTQGTTIFCTSALLNTRAHMSVRSLHTIMEQPVWLYCWLHARLPKIVQFGNCTIKVRQVQNVLCLGNFLENPYKTDLNCTCMNCKNRDKHNMSTTSPSPNTILKTA